MASEAWQVTGVTAGQTYHGSLVPCHAAPFRRMPAFPIARRSAMPNTFYWHDYETFGISTRRGHQLNSPASAPMRAERDRQAADDLLPSADYLPDGPARGILPQTCVAQGLPEHQFAAAIERELGEPGTVGLGYNTLRFDDEVHPLHVLA